VNTKRLIGVYGSAVSALLAVLVIVALIVFLVGWLDTSMTHRVQ